MKTNRRVSIEEPARSSKRSVKEGRSAKEGRSVKEGRSAKERSVMEPPEVTTASAAGSAMVEAADYAGSGWKRVVAHRNTIGQHAAAQYTAKQRQVQVVAPRDVVPEIRTIPHLELLIQKSESSQRQHLLAVVFLNPWCTESHQLAQALPSIARYYPLVRLVTADCHGSAKMLSDHCSVMQTPSLLVYKKGKEVAALRSDVHMIPCDEIEMRRLLNEHGGRPPQMMPQEQRWQQYQAAKWAPPPMPTDPAPPPPMPPPARLARAWRLDGDAPPIDRPWASAVFVDLATIDASVQVRIDEGLARELGEAGQPRCLLQLPCARALTAVQASLKPRGLSLVVLGGYRPWESLRRLVGPKVDVRAPAACALCRGTAVEVTVCRLESSATALAPADIVREVSNLAVELRVAMRAQGFEQRDVPTTPCEWIHPQMSHSFPVIDVPPSALLPVGPKAAWEAHTAPAAPPRSVNSFGWSHDGGGLDAQDGVGRAFAQKLRSRTWTESMSTSAWRMLLGPSDAAGLDRANGTTPTGHLRPNAFEFQERLPDPAEVAKRHQIRRDGAARDLLADGMVGIATGSGRDDNDLRRHGTPGCSVACARELRAAWRRVLRTLE